MKTTTRTPTDLREWLKKIDQIGELQTVTGANTEEDIGMATELLGRTRPSKATIFDEIQGHAKGWRVPSNSPGSVRAGARPPRPSLHPPPPPPPPDLAE